MFDGHGSHAAALCGCKVWLRHVVDVPTQPVRAGGLQPLRVFRKPP